MKIEYRLEMSGFKVRRVNKNIISFDFICQNEPLIILVQLATF